MLQKTTTFLVIMFITITTNSLIIASHKDPCASARYFLSTAQQALRGATLRCAYFDLGTLRDPNRQIPQHDQAMTRQTPAQAAAATASSPLESTNPMITPANQTSRVVTASLATRQPHASGDESLIEQQKKQAVLSSLYLEDLERLLLEEPDQFKPGSKKNDARIAALTKLRERYQTTSATSTTAST